MHVKTPHTTLKSKQWKGQRQLTWSATRDSKKKRRVHQAKGKTPYWSSASKQFLQYGQNILLLFYKCNKVAEASKLHPGCWVSPVWSRCLFPKWTSNWWNGRCLSAPPVDLWAPPVPFGNQWPPCTSWCPGSSLIHWSERGGWGFACQLESSGCWFSAQLAAPAASTDGCHTASPWNAQIPQSEVS